MSLGSARANLAFELAPHQLNNLLYNAQTSISPYLIPPSSFPIVFDSTVMPAVAPAFQAYYDTPRTAGPASGSIGIYGRYRDFASTEGTLPTNMQQPLGRPMPATTRLNYLGCPQ